MNVVVVVVAIVVVVEDYYDYYTEERRVPCTIYSRGATLINVTKLCMIKFVYLDQIVVLVLVLVLV